MVLLRSLLAGIGGLLLVSCGTGTHVSGVYHSLSGSAQLILKSDSSFEWIYPGSKAVEIGNTSTNRNLLYFSGGKWAMQKNQLVLTPSPVEDASVIQMPDDSISRFTSISAINFWNRFGEQVKIRAIRLPGSDLKPHFGNTLFFFAQDFRRKDTLVFYLDGYRTFTYPGSIPGAIGDNIHKITLYEPCHETDQTVIRIRGKKLYAGHEYYVKKS